MIAFYGKLTDFDVANKLLASYQAFSNSRIKRLIFSRSRSSALSIAISMCSIISELHDELDEISRKPELGAGDLEIIHKLTDTIKNIDKICMLEDGDGYSEAVDGSDYGRGSSYANRGKHYVPEYIAARGWCVDAPISSLRTV